MSITDKNKKQEVVYYPAVKTFKFTESTDPDVIDAEVNEFIKEQALLGNRPMPGKCFSTLGKRTFFGKRRGGHVYYVIAFSQSETK